MFKPLNGRVLVEEIAEPEETAGGIHLPQNSMERRPKTGRVVSISHCDHVLNVGDVVILPRIGGIDIKIDDVPYRVIPELDILGVLS
jgi:co-chaperonin GroES (HSP10)